MRLPFLPLFAGLIATGAAIAAPTGNVIFLHPDGSSLGSWMATRFLEVGPAGQLHWDRLPHLALYDGRLTDALSASSNGGATVHAWGVRAPHAANGFNDPSSRVTRVR
jgi:alkaline phosphatase